MEFLCKLLAEVETDENSVFDKEDNGPDYVLEDNFSDHECFREHDTQSEDDGDFGNEEVNNTKWFKSKDGVKWRQRKLKQKIRFRCHNIVSSYLEQKNQRKM
ncbi:hypothetical protein AVEN_202477-1 [Araneus ventricosus]|uniref:Uncharacterized protein n=1 Tax=Araneus ventricosus TaxID=182803 RepID=A0A4Y2MYB0_ARAVE|nr:hypothetical protein AVEN_202477-1 [Araneus ventricosus]